jgi:MftR C-terminal domain
MDRLEATQAALCAALADPALKPVQAALAVLDQELGAMTGWLAAQQDASQAREAIRRFSNLIRATPALRAYQADMTDQSASAAAGVLAARAGTTADNPEPQITARALLGLWPVQADSLRRHLDRAATPALLHQRVTADVRRAEPAHRHRAARIRRPRVTGRRPRPAHAICRQRPTRPSTPCRNGTGLLRGEQPWRRPRQACQHSAAEPDGATQ